MLRGLNPHKATGPDDMSCRLLKEYANEIAPVIQLLYQASINQGTLPSDWKTAYVVPILKKGDKCKAENYRPVSLTSVVYKLMEHILCSNIHDHVDKKKILHDAQHVFRKHRSCESQLKLTVQDLANNIDNSGQTDVILLDFSKAFDKVPHERLLYKLEFYGIRGNNLQWIEISLQGAHNKSCWRVRNLQQLQSSPVTTRQRAWSIVVSVHKRPTRICLGEINCSPFCRRLYTLSQHQRQRRRHRATKRS